MVLRCGVGVLQDMVVAVADAAADAYLAEAGVSRAGESLSEPIHNSQQQVASAMSWLTVYALPYRSRGEP